MRILTGLRQSLSRARILCTSAVITALSLNGCLDIENTLRFESDGVTTMTSRLIFDKEMEDVLKYVEHIARISPQPEAAALGAGICASASLANGGMPNGMQITSRQFTEKDYLVCELRLRVREMPQEAMNAGGLDIFTIEDNSTLRVKTIRLDFEKLPDMSPLVLMGMQEQLKQNRELAGKISNRDLIELLDATRKALTAMVTMTARNRYIEMSVSGGRVIETDGEISADGRSAKLRMTYAGLIDVLFKTEARKGQKFFAKITY